MVPALGSVVGVARWFASGVTPAGELVPLIPAAGAAFGGSVAVAAAVDVGPGSTVAAEAEFSPPVVVRGVPGMDDPAPTDGCELACCGPESVSGSLSGEGGVSGFLVC
ncbi:hypothetical protein FMUAM8_09140 [Nocardia cyriacigeorgica]|nr:hypothetical protein FMUAM8_09140 [Nocardia cyriacigeorgica]